jgi:hypothetical protein
MIKELAHRINTFDYYFEMSDDASKFNSRQQRAVFN